MDDKFWLFSLLLGGSWIYNMISALIACMYAQENQHPEFRFVLSSLFKSSTTYPEPGYSSSVLRKEAQIALSLAHHEL